MKSAVAIWVAYVLWGTAEVSAPNVFMNRQNTSKTLNPAKWPIMSLKWVIMIRKVETNFFIKVKFVLINSKADYTMCRAGVQVRHGELHHSLSSSPGSTWAWTPQKRNIHIVRIQTFKRRDATEKITSCLKSSWESWILKLLRSCIPWTFVSMRMTQVLMRWRWHVECRKAKKLLRRRNRHMTDRQIKTS